MALPAGNGHAAARRLRRIVGTGVAIAIAAAGVPTVRGTALAQGAEHAAHVTSLQTSHDRIPNFSQRPTIVSGQSGNWSSPGTWVQGRLPGRDDVVLIAEGHHVSYDRSSDIAVAVLGIAGTLEFRTDIPTRLVSGTVLVHPSGTLEIGTQARPVRPDVTAEVLFDSRPLYTSTADPASGVVDPEQYGTGLIVLGTIVVRGQSRAPAWVRLADEPLAGQMTVQLLQPVRGWLPGDTIVIPDTRHLRIEHPDRLDLVQDTETETIRLRAVSSDGLRLTLETPLRFNHRGARDPDGTPSRSSRSERLLPHAANLTRNVRFGSVNPASTRGHALFTDRARVDIHDAAWTDMGRTSLSDLDSATLNADGTAASVGTNQIGRYWTHFHHLAGQPRPEMPQGLSPAAIREWLDRYGWQYEFIGNAVWNSLAVAPRFKWGVAIHGSHFGRITDNVIMGVAGAGLQTEVGHESYNLIARNFVVGVQGLGRLQVPVPSTDNDVTANIGRDGSGFWFRGGHNWIEGNVAADVRFSGHYLSRYYLPIARGIPRFPGASDDDTIDIRILPVLAFADQEAYGPMEQGLYGAAASGWLDAPAWPDEVRVERFTAWHPYFQQIEWYRNGRTTFSDLVLRGDPAVAGGPALGGADMRTVGMRLLLYENVNLTILRADIRGLAKGIDLPTRTDTGTTRLTDSVLQNYINVAMLTNISRADTEIRDVQFLRFGGTGPKRLTWGYNNLTLRAYDGPLDIVLERESRKVDPGASYRFRVFGFNARGGDDFDVYDPLDAAPCAGTRSGVAGTTCPVR